MKNLTITLPDDVARWRRAVEFARREPIILFGPAGRGFPGKRQSRMPWFAT